MNLILKRLHIGTTPVGHFAIHMNATHMIFMAFDAGPFSCKDQIMETYIIINRKQSVGKSFWIRQELVSIRLSILK